MNEELGMILFGVLVVGIIVTLRILAGKFKIFVLRLDGKVYYCRHGG